MWLNNEQKILSDQDIVSIVDELKYHMKQPNLTKIAISFNNKLNEFIEENQLDSDPHMFAVIKEKKIMEKLIPTLKYFEYKHLPEKLQPVSKKVYELAMEMHRALPNCAEKTAGLRKLLEAKDCFVRAYLEN